MARYSDWPGSIRYTVWPVPTWRSQAGVRPASGYRSLQEYNPPVLKGKQQFAFKRRSFNVIFKEFVCHAKINTANDTLYKCLIFKLINNVWNMQQEYRPAGAQIQKQLFATRITLLRSLNARAPLCIQSAAADSNTKMHCCSMLAIMPFRSRGAAFL